MAVPARELIEIQPDPAHLLDGVVLEQAWVRPIRLALQELAQSLAPEDAAVLVPLASHRGVGEESIGAVRAGNLLQIPDRTDLRVTVALLAWSREAPGPALTTLTALLVNAALGPEGRDPDQRKRIRELAKFLRVAIDDSRAPLRAALAGADGVSSLRRHLDRVLGAGDQTHQSFNGLWQRWLRHRVVRWIHAEPERLSRTLGARPELTIDMDAPFLPVAATPLEDGDDQLDLSSTDVSGVEFRGLGERSIHALATAQQLLRRSGDPGLSLPPDKILPVGVIQHVARSSLKAGEDAVAAGSLDVAEEYLALAFAIAIGLREKDLGQVSWGGEGDGDVVVDPNDPVAWLRLKRPPNAVKPPAELVDHLKASADVIHWPLPVVLHESLKALRSGNSAPQGLPVFPLVHATLGAYRLRNVVAKLQPDLQLGASPFRQVLATNLAASFGPEVAQLVMRDSFATSLGPSYYGWNPESTLMTEVAGLLAKWFGQPVAPLGGRNAGVGSRIAVKDDLARQWPKRLSQEAYSAARRKGGRLAHLVAERNHLAGALCAIAGIRPGQCIGNLMLDSVIPEYGLVILEDKQVDVLRRTRVAATGRRWAAALGEYLRALTQFVSHEDPVVATWAEQVLRSEQPLFSAPNAAVGVERLDMSVLRATMPAILAPVHNYYRHRINQLLQARNVDWELRHAQLGWVVSPCFALSDQSPHSARSFGEKLGEVIDELVVEEGWYTRRQRVPAWDWAGLPSRPIPDWDARLEKYEREHASYERGVREAFIDKRREMEERVLPRLAQAFDELIPLLAINVSKRELGFAEEFPASGALPLTMDHYALIRDRVRRDDDDPTSALEGLAAEHLIHDLVMKAIRRGIVSGPEPPRRHLGVTAQLSPFLPGLGLAVRHAGMLRTKLNEIAATGRAHDKAGVAQLTILAETPYRAAELASAAVGAAAKSIRCASQPGWLRVPAVLDRREVPMVVAGTDAVALARRGREAPEGKARTDAEFGAWLESRFNGIVAIDGDSDAWLARVGGTLRMAGRLELSGPERLVMDGKPAAEVSTQRILAVVDAWPLQTSTSVEDDVGYIASTKEPRDRGSELLRRSDNTNYRRLTAALNPAVARGNSGGASDGKRAWRQRLDKALELLLVDVGSSSNLGLLTLYIAHRLRYGGRKKRHLSQRSLHKELTRFGGSLLDVLGRRQLSELSSSDLQEAFLAVLCRKPASTRPEVLEELQKFHRHLEGVHHIPAVDFSELLAFVGPRLRSSDAGALTYPEVARVLLELQEDLRRERERLDASPDGVRACALRVLLYLVLEASGVRPGSAYGLVLGDLQLHSPGTDYIHVHRTGEYGEAKTTTSVGFVRLDGELWATHREWVIEWISKEREQLGEAWWKLPVFAESAGARRRFAQQHLTRRIDVLLQWASDQRRARTYWLRKRRVTLRLSAALNHQEPTAHGVYAAVRESGHADILTPLMHYVYDAAVPVSQYLRSANMPNRARVLVMSGVSASPLDATWHRQRRVGDANYYGPVLDRLDVPIAVSVEERVTDAPILKRQRELLPMHVDTYARVYRRHNDRNEAMSWSGLTGGQVETLEAAIGRLLIRNGFAPWRIEGVRQRRGIMVPARKAEGTTKLYQLMNQVPDDYNRLLADAWQSQGYIHRLHGDDVILVLDSEDLRDAAERLLQKTQVSCQLAMSGETWVLSARTDDDGSGGRHAAAVRWVLAMIWLYGCLLLRR